MAPKSMQHYVRQQNDYLNQPHLPTLFYNLYLSPNLLPKNAINSGKLLYYNEMGS